MPEKFYILIWVMVAQVYVCQNSLNCSLSSGIYVYKLNLNIICPKIWTKEGILHIWRQAQNFKYLIYFNLVNLINYLS